MIWAESVAVLLHICATRLLSSPWLFQESYTKPGHGGTLRHWNDSGGYINRALTGEPRIMSRLKVPAAPHPFPPPGTAG